MDRFRWRMTCRCPERRPERKNRRRKERPRRICPKKHCLKPGRRSCRQGSHLASKRCGTAGGNRWPAELGLIGKVIQRTGHGVGFARYKGLRPWTLPAAFLMPLYQFRYTHGCPAVNVDLKMQEKRRGNFCRISAEERCKESGIALLKKGIDNLLFLSHEFPCVL